jgi:methyl-accepting chemotaxis protein
VSAFLQGVPTGHRQPSSLEPTVLTTPSTDDREVGIQADRLMLVLLLVCCVSAVLIGHTLSSVDIALSWGAILSALGGMTYLAFKGSALSRYALPLLLCASVALQIQVSLGMLEFHFGVFATLAVVMVYRDWKPILASAAFFAVHHVLFDRLQAAGFNIYCTTQADFSRIVLHATYVVVQTGVEIFVVRRMQQAFAQGAELNHLVGQVDQPGHIALAVQHLPVNTAVGLRLRTTLERMNEAMGAVRQAVGHIHSASQEIATGSAELSHRTEEANSYLEETASASQRIQGMVSSTARSVAQVNQAAQETADNAARGQQSMAELVTQMQGMQKHSERIADIASVVDSLAFQTNLLALNAAVEAARAGEQGRGFAVVAAEVRRLAQNSAQAAAEIRGLVEQTVRATAAGTQTSMQVQSSMQSVAQGIARTAQSMADIAAAASGQQSGIAQINDAIAHLNQVTKQNAALAEESHAAATSLEDRMAEVAAHMAVFEVSR